MAVTQDRLMRMTCRNIRWLPLGVAVGTAFGVALDNIAVGVALGAGIGVALDAARGGRNR